MKLAAFAVAAVSLVTVHATAAPAPALAPQKITIDARGPLALVEVTRTVVPEPAQDGGGNEALLDLALPDASALVSVEVRDAGRWRGIDPASEGSAHAAETYRAESAARRVTPASEPYDESTTHRLRLLRSAGAGTAPFTVRYRFAVLPEAANGRLRVRFPAAIERLPPAAEVALRLTGAADANIAGVPVPLAAGAETANGRASTRSAWEILWTPRNPSAPGAPLLEARVALAPLGPQQSALAFLARRRPGPSSGSPGSVLFLVDRSRSVGLPGLSAERDLVRALIEALPPSTRFDALFFDRGTRRLFPMSRPATRQAIEGFEAEMVPDRMQNGTDLPAALHEAGALLRREATTFGPRALLVLVTDGALGDEDGAALDRALGGGLGNSSGSTPGSPPGLDVSLAALTVRAVDDEPAGARARDALRALAAARGGVARELRASELGDGVPAALADLQHGGDLGAIRLVADGVARRISESLTPGGLLAGVVPWKGRPPRTVRIEAIARGQRITVAPIPTRLAPEWLRPWVVSAPASASANPTRFLSAPSVVALVEPVLHSSTASAASETAVKGSMDRMVIRNVLSLAYMPRARACYLNRTAATPALRDLAGKVRLAIELARGEVGGVKIESSTLGNPEIERCLQESAFEIEVPRAARSDAPVTAVLNMVFRPRTSDKRADVDLGEVGNEIDLVIEEMHRREASAPAAGAAPPRP
ncbi:MAG TPA: VWA domain-containing protein [Polyangia bacterium]|nr:VWA domain-containing protein [Polyangia bacterium]